MRGACRLSKVSCTVLNYVGPAANIELVIII
jgi:hypothetical protein